MKSRRIRPGGTNGKVVPIAERLHGGRTHRTCGPTGGRVLVLNASYEPINVCTMRRAAVLVLKERAEVLERREGVLHSERLDLERPCVIRLVRYVRVPRDVHRRKITRRAVLARDSYTCQYCGRESARPYGRPRDPPEPRWHVPLGQHRGRLRAV